jgi:Ethylene-responsive protein kinase Le-CTR1
LSTRNYELDLSRHERVMATAMHHAIGATPAPAHFDTLARNFAHDPKNTVAPAREKLVELGQQRNNSPQAERLFGQHLDGHLGLIVKLDRTAFPATPNGAVYQGTPKYVADGLVDMGADQSQNERYRYREQIVVNKEGIFKRFRPLIENVFSADYGEVDLQKRKLRMALLLARGVWAGMRYDYDFDKSNSPRIKGGKLKLGDLSEGVCRHQALVFQSLAQVAGLETRLMKCDMNGVRHAANMIRLNNQWHIIDATNPDRIRDRATGTVQWRPGIYPIDRPPRVGEVRRYPVQSQFTNQRHAYTVHNDEMFWHIDDLSDPRTNHRRTRTGDTRHQYRQTGRLGVDN